MSRAKGKRNLRPQGKTPAHLSDALDRKPDWATRGISGDNTLPESLIADIKDEIALPYDRNDSQGLFQHLPPTFGGNSVLPKEYAFNPGQQDSLSSNESVFLPILKKLQDRIDVLERKITEMEKVRPVLVRKTRTGVHGDGQ